MGVEEINKAFEERKKQEAEKLKQHCTMEELIEVLNKIVWEQMGCARIAKLVLEKRGQGYYSYEKFN